MNEHEKIQSALDAIDPSLLSYEDWIHIGMALKSEGLPCSVWDSWSMRDMERYKPGDCLRKWDTFKGDGYGIGTVYHFAEERGWTYQKIYGWDDYLPATATNYDEVIAKGAKEEEPHQMAIRYLETLFTPDESVSYVHSAVYKEERDKWVPADGGHVRKVSAIIRDLKRCKNLDEAFGTINPEAGAWIRHNPTTGPHDKDVTRFAYCLVESDELSIEDQKKLMISLRLPIAAMIESGGKSIHAIVKIQAKDYAEFKQRVDFLFDWLTKHQFKIDEANKNPARLSRLPGAKRNGSIQRLIATNIGCESWLDWKDYIEGIDDDLPEIHSGRDMFENPAPEPPSIIEGVLRQGAKMIVTGDSKSGKTCLLTNLAVCIAEGWEWLGHQCTQGKVLYINMEVMQSDFETRYRSIYKAYGKPASEEGKDNFDFWNLRGKAQPLEKLAPKIIRRCRDKNYLVIIVDPVYKVQGGDENNAEAIGKFCALFDMISEETGASMVYVHHHAKGLQGNKKAMDRGSGSGVFSRDADAIVDFANLVLDPNTKEKARAMSQDITQEPIPLRLEMVLRSFRSPKPVNLFFEFPLHVIDGKNILDNAAIEGSSEANKLMSPNRQKSDAEKKEIVDICFGATSRPDGTARFSDMYNCDFCDVGRDALKRYILNFPDEYEYERGIVKKF